MSNLWINPNPKGEEVKAHYLWHVLTKWIAQKGPDLDIVVEVGELHLEPRAVSVVKLEYPEGASVIALNCEGGPIGEPLEAAEARYASAREQGVMKFIESAADDWFACASAEDIQRVTQILHDDGQLQPSDFFLALGIERATRPSAERSQS